MSFDRQQQHQHLQQNSKIYQTLCSVAKSSHLMRMMLEPTLLLLMLMLLLLLLLLYYTRIIIDARHPLVSCNMQPLRLQSNRERQTEKKKAQNIFA